MSTIQIPCLISEAYFKKYSPIPDNYNIDDIRPYFNVAETIWVKPILGIPLYEELLQQVVENKVTEENSTLLLMLYPYLAFAITLEAMPFISYHLSEVGLTVGHSDNSTAAPVSGLNIVLTRLRSTVETLKTHFKKWLDEHSDSFPLYCKEDCSCDSNVCDDCQWVMDYYGGDYSAYKRSVWMNQNKPSTRLQAFTTRRRPIDIK